jgi:tetratricopeptide (TPR) repeat protein
MRNSRKALASITLAAAITGGYYLNQPDPNAIYLEGRKAVDLNQWALVRDKSEVLRNFADHASHRALLRAFAFKSRGQMETALVEFSKAQSHPATREESYFQGGSICYELKQYRDCIQLLRQVLKWNPEHFKAHQLLAAAYYDIGSMGMALESLKNVIRLRPDDFRPHYLQGTIYVEVEEFDDAQSAFAAAARLAAVDSTVGDEIRAEWGNALIRLRRYDEALAAMEPARPWPDILTNRAQACFSLRRFDDAQKYAEEALRLAPTKPEAAIISAQIHERNGDVTSGISLLQQCLGSHPMDLVLHQRLAELLAGAGRAEESLLHRKRAGELAELRQQFSMAHKSVATDTTNPVLRLKLADLAEKLGETELARGWYLAALGISPNDEQIQERWKQFQAQNPLPASLSSPREKPNHPDLPASSLPSRASAPVEF